MKKLLRSLALTLTMTLVVVQPAHAFAQFIAPLVSKVVQKIMEAGASQPSQSLPAPLTPEEITRGVPAGTLEGTMSPPNGRLVLMDGEVRRLAPGSKIYDSKNRIVLPGRIQGDIPVRYTTDYLGNVSAVWLLSDPQYASTALRRANMAREDEGREDEAPLDVARTDERR